MLLKLNLILWLSLDFMFKRVSNFFSFYLFFLLKLIFIFFFFFCFVMFDRFKFFTFRHMLAKPMVFLYFFLSKSPV
jgi:hypothetical protein